MFDVFYSGIKPNQFAHEREADSIEHAQSMCRTRYFWWITYLADYSTFDFLWEPAPWQSHQRHAWPSQHQPDSGTYLIPGNWDKIDTNYHHDRTIVRTGNKDCWNIPTNIDPDSIDYSWHPSALDSPYVYHFPSQWQQTSGVIHSARR